MELDQDAVFRIGKVEAVRGRRVRISVDQLKNSAHLLYRGALVRNVSVSSYVKIVKGFVDLIAKVDGETVEENYHAGSAYQHGTDKFSRHLEVSLVGFIQSGRFERGIQELPLLDNECFILTSAETDLIHSFVKEGDTALTIGTLANETTQSVSVGVNEIFASHVGIFGNTGSGKSYTLAKLYHELFKTFGTNEAFKSRAKFVLFDFNGEYVNRTHTDDDYATSVITDGDLKRVYAPSTGSKNGDLLPLPASAIYDPIFWTVLLDATEKTQAPFIARVLKNEDFNELLKHPRELLDLIGDLLVRATKSGDVSIDRQLPINFLEEIADCFDPSQIPPALIELIDEFRSYLQYHIKNQTFFWKDDTPNPAIYSSKPDWHFFIKGKVIQTAVSFDSFKGIDLVRFKLVLQYYRDVIRGFANREHLGPMMKRMHTRVPDIKRVVEVSDQGLTQAPLTIVSLRDVNLAMRKIIPLLLCKHLYEDHKNSDLQRHRYLNLIIDEAHNILSAQSSRETDAWRDYRLETFEEIIKEGRKFNVFLTLASQRPHDISSTIISQLHNYFLHRLVNDLDVSAIEKSVSFLDRVSFESLPILPTGTCVLAGVSAQVPVIVRISALPDAAAPNSRTMSVTTEWLTSVGDEFRPPLINDLPTFDQYDPTDAPPF